MCPEERREVAPAPTRPGKTARLRDGGLIGAAVGAAFGLSALRRTAGRDRGDLRADAPAASYLLSVEQALAPRSLLRRLTLRG
ncbi:hypothetical protein [Streptomyces sp. NBC_00342]|uniref:hypothetical protein n=1 Tax=Streptomyces sp. NBC_00342 TaxID=2975718 RepID=UPI002E2A14D7|nr:hypothetical protein [Streptomyces sp. NBC_00342]